MMSDDVLSYVHSGGWAQAVVNVIGHLLGAAVVDVARAL
jgi:hypothetical protein